MKAQLVKPVKYDLSSRSSVFTPVSPISKTEILFDKYPVKFYRILPDSRILPDIGIQIRYIPTVNLHCHSPKNTHCFSPSWYRLWLTMHGSIQRENSHWNRCRCGGFVPAWSLHCHQICRSCWWLLWPSQHTRVAKVLRAFQEAAVKAHYSPEKTLGWKIREIVPRNSSKGKL